MEKAGDARTPMTWHGCLGCVRQSDSDGSDEEEEAEKVENLNFFIEYLGRRLGRWGIIHPTHPRLNHSWPVVIEALPLFLLLLPRLLFAVRMDATTNIQNYLGMVASLLATLRGLFDFSSPPVSSAIFAVLAVSTVFHLFVSPRFVCLVNACQCLTTAAG